MASLPFLIWFGGSSTLEVIGLIGGALLFAGASRYRNKQNRKIHKAIELKCSDDVILALLEENTGAAGAASAAGDLPLHLAIEHNCSNKVILALLAANSYAANEKNHYQKLPLFIAIELNKTEEIILALISAYPDAACERDSNNMVLIYQAIQKGYSDSILAELLAAVFNSKRYDNEELAELLAVEELLAAALSFKRCDEETVRDEALRIIKQSNREEAVLKAATILSDHKRCKMLCKIIKSTNSDNVLVSLASKYPTFTTMSNGDGPVNLALTYKRSDQVILALLEVNGNYAKKGIKENHYPLHNAMKQERSDEVVLALLAANPEAALEIDRIDATLPLHNAIKGKRSVQVILALLKAITSAATEMGSIGKLPLLMAIEMKYTDDVVLALLSAHSKAALETNANNLLPIQCALKKNYSDAVVVALLIAYVKHSHLSGHNYTLLKDIVQVKGKELILRAAEELNDDKRQNIIFRSLFDALDNLVISMVSRFPETLKIKGGARGVNLALHTALEFKRSKEVVLAIFNGYKEASKEKSQKGELPLHQAIRNNYSDEVVLALFDAYNNASQKVSVDGNLLLHQAIKNKYSDQVTLKILSAYPCAATKPCQLSGKLPLLMAIEYNCHEEIILALLEANKDAAKGSWKGIPLLMAIASKSSNAVILGLLSAYPEAACNRIQWNKSPLQKALELNYSDVVIVSLLIAALNNGDLSGNKDDQGSRRYYLNSVVQVERGPLILQAAERISNSTKHHMMLRNIIETIEIDSLVISMVTEFPVASRERYGDGKFALHIALELKRSDEVVLFILGACYQASQKATREGKLPLHQAIQNNYSDKVALEILFAYPCAAMIRCTQSGMLPLHLAAATSASPRLVEALISEYPEALQIAVNNLIPRDLVTDALPMESIKLICRPSLHYNKLVSTMFTEKTKVKDSESVEGLKLISTEVDNQSLILKGGRSELLHPYGEVEVSQKELTEKSDQSTAMGKKSAELSEGDSFFSEPDLVDVSSEGSNLKTFNSFVFVGNHIRENTLKSSALFDIGAGVQNLKAKYSNEVDNYDAVEGNSSENSRSDGSGSFGRVTDYTVTGSIENLSNDNGHFDLVEGELNK